MKLYMFRTVPLSIIRSFSLYTQQTSMYCCVYSEKLLMMDRGTVRNMHSFIPKINLRNQCIYFVLWQEIYHDAWSHGRQIPDNSEKDIQSIWGCTWQQDMVVFGRKKKVKLSLAFIKFWKYCWVRLRALGFCENGNELFGFHKFGKFIE